MTIEVKKTRPINRLQTIYPIRAYSDEQYQTALKAAKEGKPVVWSFGEPYAKHFFNAMKLEAVYPENYATVCAAADAAIPFLERAMADGFPNYPCGYMLNTFGYAARMKDLGDIPPEAPRGGMAKPVLLLTNSGACEARCKAWASLGRYLDAPVYTLDCPSRGGGIGGGQREDLLEGAYESNVQFMVKILRDFATFLERLLGKKLDYDKLDQDITDSMAMDAMWYKSTDELRAVRPCPMNARDHYSSMNATSFKTTEPKRVTEMFQKMYDEVKHRVDNGICGINRPEKYRMSFQGLGPWANMNLLDMWAERGWNFVREGYHPPHPIDLSWVKDPVEKIVRYRGQGLDSQIERDYSPEEAAEIKKEIMEKGFSHRATLTVADAKKYQLDGVIQYQNFSCRPTAVGTLLTQYQLMETYKVPSLVVEADMIDKRFLDVDALMKRCEAFEETMDHYREVRKKEGLPW